MVATSIVGSLLHISPYRHLSTSTLGAVMGWRQCRTDEGLTHDEKRLIAEPLMAPLQLPLAARNREEMLEQYPSLGGIAGPFSRHIDECLTALGVFSEFARDIAPYVTDLDVLTEKRADSALTRVLELACRRRVFSLAIPQSLGGTGLSMLALSVGLEHLSQTCVGIANLVATHGLALAFIGATGQARLLRSIAARIVAGERSGRAYLLATAATEPSAGSDLEDFAALGRANIESHADACAGGYRLHGRKIYVSNGSIASAFVVVMPTDRARPRETLCAFLAHTPSPEITVVRTESKLGQRASPAAEILFDGHYVASDYRLNGDSIAGRTLDLVLGSSRSVVGAFGAGVAHGLLHTAVGVAMHSLGSAQLVQQPRAQAIIARLWMNATTARQTYLAAANVQHRSGLISLMETESLRVLDRLVPRRLSQGTLMDRLLGSEFIDHEAQRLLNGLPQRGIDAASAFGAAAKVQCSELALANCDLALELLGPVATREDSGIPKYLRDARLLSIYEGTNEICTLCIEQTTRGRTRWS